ARARALPEVAARLAGARVRAPPRRVGSRRGHAAPRHLPHPRRRRRTRARVRPRLRGQGADHSYSVILGEELGRIDGAFSMAVTVQTDMSTPSLHRFGTHELKERYLAPAMRGEMVTSIAVTEPDAGSDVAALRTRAVQDGAEWVLNGTKLYITHG